MLSGFICQCHGVISGEIVASLSPAEKEKIIDLLKEESKKDPDFKPDLPEHGAFSIILPGAGKGKDGFWGGEDVALQLRHVIPIFKVIHPTSNLRFIFDNSSTHDCWSPDALNVEALVGGSTSNKLWVPMRPGFFKDHAGNVVAQDMQYPSPVYNCNLDLLPLSQSDLKDLMDLRGRSKGITKILEERNLMPAPTATPVLGTLEGECEYKIKQGPRKNQVCASRLPCRFHNPKLFKIRCDLCSLSLNDDPDRRNRTNCCQRMLLSIQDDFKGQVCMLAEIAKKNSTVNQHVEAIFLPKFHCELNCIEFLWGFMKRRVRSHVSGTISQQDFLRIIKEALVSCPVAMIRRWYRRMWKLVHLYEVGLPITVARYICKKYSSHRKIPAALMSNIDHIKLLQDCKSTKTAVFEALSAIELKL